jgi:hypothetical protein
MLATTRVNDDKPHIKKTEVGFNRDMLATMKVNDDKPHIKKSARNEPFLHLFQPPLTMPPDAAAGPHGVSKQLLSPLSPEKKTRQPPPPSCVYIKSTKNESTSNLTVPMTESFNTLTSSMAPLITGEPKKELPHDWSDPAVSGGMSISGCTSVSSMSLVSALDLIEHKVFGGNHKHAITSAMTGKRHDKTDHNMVSPSPKNRVYFHSSLVSPYPQPLRGYQKGAAPRKVSSEIPPSTLPSTPQGMDGSNGTCRIPDGTCRMTDDSFVVSADGRDLVPSSSLPSPRDRDWCRRTTTDVESRLSSQLRDEISSSWRLATVPPQTGRDYRNAMASGRGHTRCLDRADPVPVTTPHGPPRNASISHGPCHGNLRQPSFIPRTNQSQSQLQTQRDLSPDNFYNDNASSPSFLEKHTLRANGHAVDQHQPIIRAAKERQRHLQRLNEEGQAWFPMEAPATRRKTVADQPIDRCATTSNLHGSNIRGHSNSNSNDHQKSPDLVQIYPDMYVPLRSAEETEAAIVQDNYVTVRCWGCERGMFCIVDAAYVLCPFCKIIGPLDDENDKRRRHGLGMGFTGKTLTELKQKIHVGVPAYSGRS